MSAPLAEIRGLSVSYGRDDARSFALQDVDLDIAKGRRLAVIGESGSGKSTLALALAGLLAPQARVVLWEGGEDEEKKTKDERRKAKEGKKR